MGEIPKIAILGGGVGGLVAASELNYRLGTKAEITLFDRSSHHIYQPAFLHLAFGERKLDSIKRPLDLLNRQGINFLKGEIFRIDPENLLINAEHGDFEFDYMIIALGAELDTSGLEGFEDNALNLYSADGAQSINQALSDFSGGKIAIVVSSMPYKCPAAPYEMAFLLDYHLRNKKIRERTEIVIATPEPQPMPVAGEKVGQAVADMLSKLEIEYLPNQKIKSLGQYVSLADKKFKADLIIGVPPHRCPDVAKDADLTSKNGWIEVEGQGMATKFDNVYAIGDCTVITLPNGKALPKAGVFAKSQAQILAFNLAHQITKSSAAQKKFDGQGGCFLEVGHKKAAYAKGNFYHEPDPLINLKAPSRIYYYFKMLYEKYWLKAWI